MRKLIALLLITTPFLSFSQKYTLIDTLEREIETLAKPVYIETYKTVNTAKFKVNEAIAGRYSVKEAMAYYNDNLAGYLGYYKTLQSIKKRLDSSGDKFIQAMFLKEKAKISRSMAEQYNQDVIEMKAEQSFESQRKNQALKSAFDSSEGRSVSFPENYNSIIFTKVEQDAQYNGDWGRYLSTNLRAEVATDNGASPGNYQVVVQFVVDEAGNVSDVKVLKDPGFGMGEESMRVIKKSGKWKPAIQGGRQVTAYRKLPITFTIQDVASPSRH